MAQQTKMDRNAKKTRGPVYFGSTREESRRMPDVKYDSDLLSWDVCASWPCTNWLNIFASVTTASFTF